MSTPDRLAIQAKLLPCLHCGNTTPEVFHEDDDGRSTYLIECSCGIGSVVGAPAEKIITDWNRRTKSSPPNTEPYKATPIPWYPTVTWSNSAIYGANTYEFRGVPTSAQYSAESQEPACAQD